MKVQVNYKVEDGSIASIFKYKKLVFADGFLKLALVDGVSIFINLDCIKAISIE